MTRLVRLGTIELFDENSETVITDNFSHPNADPIPPSKLDFLYNYFNSRCQQGLCQKAEMKFSFYGNLVGKGLWR